MNKTNKKTFHGGGPYIMMNSDMNDTLEHCGNRASCGACSLNYLGFPKKMIEDHGGKNVSTISKNTTFVLKGNDMGPTKKQKAIKLGIDLVSEDEFLAKLN